MVWIVVCMCVCCQTAIAHVLKHQVCVIWLTLTEWNHVTLEVHYYIGEVNFHAQPPLHHTSLHLCTSAKKPAVEKKQKPGRLFYRSLFPLLPVVVHFQTTDGSHGFVFTLENPCCWSPTTFKVLLPPLPAQPWQGLLGWCIWFCTSTALPLIFALVSSHGCRNEEAWGMRKAKKAR